MIYILNEQVKNGTVTMQIINTGVEANDFTEAVTKLKQMFKNPKIEILEETEDLLRYKIPQQERFSLYGKIENKPLKII